MSDDAVDSSQLVPVTVLTGFLGSGKTTLLNHILTAAHGKKLAVIENEFGDVGIDDALLEKNTKMQADEEIIEMMNGCICCTVRQDLIVVLEKLSKRVKSGKLKLDGVIIETTGMADPAPVAQTFFVDEMVKSSFKLDGIVTLVDAKHIEQHLDDEKPEGAENEAVEQVAFADRLLLNKTDLVKEADIERVEARLKVINSAAPLLRCTKAEVSVDSVLNIGAFDLTRTLEMDPGAASCPASCPTSSYVATVLPPALPPSTLLLFYLLRPASYLCLLAAAACGTQFGWVASSPARHTAVVPPQFSCAPSLLLSVPVPAANPVPWPSQSSSTRTASTSTTTR